MAVDARLATTLTFLDRTFHLPLLLDYNHHRALFDSTTNLGDRSPEQLYHPRLEYWTYDDAFTYSYENDARP